LPDLADFFALLNERLGFLLLLFMGLRRLGVPSWNLAFIRSNILGVDFLEGEGVFGLGVMTFLEGEGDLGLRIGVMVFMGCSFAVMERVMRRVDMGRATRLVDVVFLVLRGDWTLGDSFEGDCVAFLGEARDFLDAAAFLDTTDFLGEARDFLDAAAFLDTTDFLGEARDFFDVADFLDTTDFLGEARDFLGEARDFLDAADFLDTTDFFGEARVALAGIWLGIGDAVEREH
jgi:hypothetical protein